MHDARLHKTSRRVAMARDPRRDLLGRDRDILLRDETRDASVWDWDETETLKILSETLVRFETVSRPRRLDRDHIPAQRFCAQWYDIEFALENWRTLREVEIKKYSYDTKQNKKPSCR